MPKLIDLSKTPSTGETIAIEYLQNLVDRYKNERHKHIKKHITDDTRGAWLSRKKKSMRREWFNILKIRIKSSG